MRTRERVHRIDKGVTGTSEYKNLLIRNPEIVMDLEYLELPSRKPKANLHYPPKANLVGDSPLSKG